MAWYFEQKNIFGGWSACKTPEKPVAGRSKSRPREMRCVKEIPDYLEHLTLAQIENIMGTDGQLQDAQTWGRSPT